jgi:acetylornithine/N-succinyldiaminopimelate aminotransferase
MPLSSRPDVVMSSGTGSWLTDTEGRRYLDFIQGWAVNALGHAPIELQQALTSQSALLLTPSPAYFNAPQLQLAAALCEKTGLDLAWFCSSGTEATECAIKLARKWGQRRLAGAYEVISATNAFHGRTLTAMAAGGKPGFERMFLPQTPGFKKVAFGDLEALRSEISDHTAAVLLEPIQGEAGVLMPPPGYLRAVRELCRERGLLFMLDEIQTGLGRTGSMFRFQTEECQPDVLLLGKQLGSGVPLAGVLCREDAYHLDPGEHGGTYGGNPLMAACGLAVLAAIDDGVLQNVQQRSAQLVLGLNHLSHAFGGAVRGAGLLLALELNRPIAAEVVQTARERGLLVNAPRPSTLRFMPQLRVSADEVTLMLERLGDSLRPHA